MQIGSDNSLATKLADRGALVRDEELRTVLKDFQKDFDTKVKNLLQYAYKQDQRGIEEAKRNTLQAVTTNNITNSTATETVTNNTTTSKIVNAQTAGAGEIVESINLTGNIFKDGLNGLAFHLRDYLGNIFIKARIFEAIVVSLKDYFFSGPGPNAEVVYYLKSIIKVLKKKSTEILPFDPRSRFSRAMDAHGAGGTINDILGALFGRPPGEDDDLPPGRRRRRRSRRRSGEDDENETNPFIQSIIDRISPHLDRFRGHRDQDRGRGLFDSLRRRFSGPDADREINDLGTRLLGMFDGGIARIFGSRFARNRSAALGAVALFGSHFDLALATSIMHPIKTLKSGFRGLRVYMQFLATAPAGVGVVTLVHLLGLKGGVAATVLLTLWRFLAKTDEQGRSIIGHIQNITKGMWWLVKTIVLLPSRFANAIDGVYAAIIDSISGFAVWVTRAIGDMSRTVFNFIGDSFRSGLRTFQPIVERALLRSMTKLGEFAAAAMEVVGLAIAGAVALWPVIIGGLVATWPYLLALAVAGVGVLIGKKIYETFRPEIQSAIDSVVSMMGDASEWVSRIPDKFADAWNAVKESVSEFGDKISTWFSDMFHGALNSIETKIRSFWGGDTIADLIFGKSEDIARKAPQPTTTETLPYKGPINDSAAYYKSIRQKSESNRQREMMEAMNQHLREQTELMRKNKDQATPTQRAPIVSPVTDPSLPTMLGTHK